ncbi:hypothetical protein AB4463_23150, partial [Vibrio cyclitrophicus]
IGLVVFIAFLSGCGGDSKSSSSQGVVSVDDFKKNYETVIDSDTGVTYRQITVDEGAQTTISLKDNEVFSLTSSDGYSEKLVVKGNLTIK